MDPDQKLILIRLLQSHCTGKHHLTETTITRWFPGNKQGDAKKALHRLVTQGYVWKRPTQNGEDFTIFPSRVRAIKDILELP